MFRQDEESVPANQSKKNSDSSITSKREFTLRPPFGIDDQTQVLARFRASRPRPPVDPLHSRRRKRIPPIEFEVNPNMKTMYQYQFNDPADERLGFCDNRSIESLNNHFKRCQRHQRNVMEAIKMHLPELPPRKYRSDRNKRVSEYTAEISYVGAKIMSNKIHDHSQCGRLPKNCVHYIEF